MSSLFLLQNSEVLDLFEIKINDFEGYFRFHGSKNFNKDIVFNGNTYLYIPSEISNLEYNSEGKQNRPTLSIANINNFITNFIKDRNDLLGARFYKKKILAKDLDAVNFGGENKNLLGVRNSNNFISSDLYTIQKKNFETKEKVEFTLASILDLDGLTAPSRKVYNDSCHWQYRGCGCNYGKINGYKGPQTEIGFSPFNSLSDINTYNGNNLTSNLVVWLRPEGINTSGTTVMKQYNSPRSEIFSQKTYEKITSWTNEGTATSPVAPTITRYPKLYKNSGRLNNKNGAYFTTDYFNVDIDSIIINQSYTNKDVTVFCVLEMVAEKYLPGSFWNTCSAKGGLIRAGLTTDTNNTGGNRFILGYWENQEDVFYSQNKYYNNVNSDRCSSIGDARIYGAVMPKTLTEITNYIKNGEIYPKVRGVANQPGYLGINTYNNYSSEIVLYELIVYDKILTNDQVKQVNAYLSNKYNISISYDASYIKYKPSSEYFVNSEGNLGIPVCDENNKLFLKAASAKSSKTNYESYNLNTLTWKGIYNKDTQYNQGDFVKLDPSIDYDFNEKSMYKNYEVPSKFFVCISQNGSKGVNPASNTNIWIEDRCSKNLNGCLLRFDDSKINIPFGGFPGTVGYEYKLPN